MSFEGRHESGLKEGRFSGAQLAFEENQRLLAAQSDELVDVLASTEQMRRVGAFEAEGFGAQQYRAAPARETKQPPAGASQRQRGDPELPLIEPGEDAEDFPYRVGETVDRGKQHPDHRRQCLSQAG